MPSSSPDHLTKALLFRTQSRRLQSPRMSRQEKYPARSSFVAQSKLLSDSTAAALLSPEVLKRAGEVEAEQKSLANELKSGKRQNFFVETPITAKQRKVRIGLEVPATATATTTPEFEPVTPPQSTTSLRKYSVVSEPATDSSGTLRSPSFFHHRRGMSAPIPLAGSTALRSPSFSQHRRGMSAPAPLDIDALRRERQYSGPFSSNPLLSQSHTDDLEKDGDGESDDGIKTSRNSFNAELEKLNRKLPPIHQMLSSPFAPGIKASTSSSSASASASSSSLESKENARRLALKKEKFMDLCEQLWEVLSE